MLFIVLYIVFIAMFTWFQRNRLSSPVFTGKRDISWLVSGASLAMFHFYTINGQLLYGIISEKQMAGIWMPWSASFIFFVVPIVFGPLWYKLNLKTDNAFILFRFQGKGAELLYVFRSIYVGLIMTSLILSINLKQFSRVLEVYYGIEAYYAIGIAGLLLFIFAMKNILSLKIRTDFVQITLSIIGISTIAYFVAQASGGLSEIRAYMQSNPESASLFYTNGDASIWFNMFVFIFINWWSALLFDGSSPEMVRYATLRSSKEILWAGLTPAVILLVIFFLTLSLVLMISLLSQQYGGKEIVFIEQIFKYVPARWEGLVLVTYFILFITISETFLAWGASFLSIDFYKNYINKDVSRRQFRVIALGIMLAMCALATLIALSSDQLQQMIKIFFSISAGVGPVYILRWIWFRINAWSQITAMLASAVCTLSYPRMHEWTPLSGYNMYDVGILVVTLFTSICWISVTLLTPDNSETVRAKMMPIIERKSIFIKRLFLAIAMGIGWIGVHVAIWYGIFL